MKNVYGNYYRVNFLKRVRDNLLDTYRITGSVFIKVLPAGEDWFQIVDCTLNK